MFFCAPVVVDSNFNNNIGSIPVSGGFNKQQSEARTHVQNYETDLLGIYLSLSNRWENPALLQVYFRDENFGTVLENRGPNFFMFLRKQRETMKVDSSIYEYL